jgi:hypothetical protein
MPYKELDMSDTQGTGTPPEERKPGEAKPAAPKVSSKEAKPADLFEPWRQFRDVYLDFWSKNMVEAVNSEAYAQASGVMLDTVLTTSIPFRESLEKAMTAALQQLSMPTRADFVSAAERLTNVEMKLDDLDIKLDRIERLLSDLSLEQALSGHAAEAPSSEPALDSPVSASNSPRRRSAGPRKK